MVFSNSTTVNIRTAARIHADRKLFRFAANHMDLSKFLHVLHVGFFEDVTDLSIKFCINFKALWGEEVAARFVIYDFLLTDAATNRTTADLILDRINYHQGQILLDVEAL